MHDPPWEGAGLLSPTLLWWSEVGGLDGSALVGGDLRTWGQLLELRGWLAPWKRAVEASVGAPLSPHEYCLQCWWSGKLHPPTADPGWTWVLSESWEGGSRKAVTQPLWLQVKFQGPLFSVLHLS